MTLRLLHPDLNTDQMSTYPCVPLTQEAGLNTITSSCEVAFKPYQQPAINTTLSEGHTPAHTSDDGTSLHETTCNLRELNL